MRKHRDPTVAALAIAAGILPLLARADDYRWDTGVDYSRFSGSGEDTDYWSLGGTYYLRDVTTDELPLQEAAYLGRASSVSAAVSRFDSPFGDFDQWRLSGEFYVPSAWLYFSAGLTGSDTLGITVDDDGDVSIARGNDTAWDATIGITPFDGLRLSTSFHQHLDYEPNLDVKYVGRLGNDHWYGFGVNLVDPDGGDLTYAVSGDYFIDRTLRVGAELGEHHFGVSVDKFFTDRLSVGLRYRDFDEADGDVLTLRASWRF